MPKLSIAKRILTDQKIYLDERTQAAEAAKAISSTQASAILAAAITTVTEQMNLSAKVQAKSKHNTRGPNGTRDSDRRYGEIATLHTELLKQIETIRAVKSRYDDEERHRIDVERESARVAAELAHPHEAAAAKPVDESIRVLPPPPTASTAAPTNIATAAVTTIGAGVSPTPTPSPALVTPVETPPLPLKKKASSVFDVDERENDDYLYTLALHDLRTLNTNPYPELKKHVDALINQVKYLKEHNKERVSELTEVLKKTYLRLTGKLKTEEYEAIAKTVQGKPSLALQILGGVMIALGIAIAVLGIVFFPAITGVVAAAGIAATTAVAGTTIGVSSAVFAATGAGLFAVGFRKGLSAEMGKVDGIVQAQNIDLSVAKPGA